MGVHGNATHGRIANPSEHQGQLRSAATLPRTFGLSRAGEPSSRAYSTRPLNHVLFVMRLSGGVSGVGWLESQRGRLREAGPLF
jgi:hypothetical protein